MSTVATKNLLLSQPKAGQVEFIPVTTLPHTTLTGDTSTEIKIEIPGVDPSTVSVEFEGHTLVVGCEKGTLTLPLNPGTDIAKISADILWGMLTITVPLPAPPAVGSIKVSIHDAVKKTSTKANSKFTEEN